MRHSAATCSHSAGTGRPAATSHEQAMRHGSRMAASPPGSRTGGRWRDPVEPLQRADQQLAAPHRAVGAQARCRRRSPPPPCPARRARPGRRRGGRGGAARPTRLHPLELQRVLGREVLGVQVVGHHLRPHGEQALEVLDPVAEGAQGLPVAQVADVVAHPRATAPRQAEGVLLLGPAGQQRRRVQRQGHRLGHVAARAPDHQRRPVGGAHHRVVGAHVDGPVVHEEQVRDRGQALAGVVVAGRRSARRRRCRWSSPAARPRRPAAGGAAASRAASRRGRACDGATDSATRAPGPAARDHDRPLAAGEQLLLGGRELHQLPGRRRGPAPSGRTAGPRGACAPAARATACSSRGEAGQVVAAQPLHRHDAPGARAPPRQRRSRRSDGPQSGHALGWAWKRRSAGSSYSAWQAGHISKPAIVVSGRS